MTYRTHLAEDPAAALWLPVRQVCIALIISCCFVMYSCCSIMHSKGYLCHRLQC